jgi:tRNA (guanine-N7-)-methyltransferase
MRDAPADKRSAEVSQTDVQPITDAGTALLIAPYIFAMLIKRSIRSYVRRTGRLTPSQSRALEDLWPRYGCDFADQPLDLDKLFGRSANRVLEIGFGNGDSLVQQATSYPQQDYLGIEMHRPGAGHCLLQAADADLCNLRIFLHDAVEVLQQQIDKATLSRINLYFPDPWPKSRHQKRRIFQASFLDLAASRLHPGGSLYVATDWANYAEHIDAVIADCPLVRVAGRREHEGEHALDRPTTKYETRGLKKGHRITDWRLEKI